jgi:hypothetical protein
MIAVARCGWAWVRGYAKGLEDGAEVEAEAVPVATL